MSMEKSYETMWGCYRGSIGLKNSFSIRIVVSNSDREWQIEDIPVLWGHLLSIPKDFSGRSSPFWTCYHSVLSGFQRVQSTNLRPPKKNYIVSKRSTHFYIFWTRWAAILIYRPPRPWTLDYNPHTVQSVPAALCLSDLSAFDSHNLRVGRLG
jgi:hypothetical protein